MNNLPELTHDEAKSIISRNTALTMPYTAKFAPDILAQTYAATLAMILVLSRDPNINDHIFRNGIEDIINPSGLTPEPEAGITLTPGSVRNAFDPAATGPLSADHPANDPSNLVPAVIAAQSGN